METPARLAAAQPHTEELQRRIEKLQKINAALMQRVERSMDAAGQRLFAVPDGHYARRPGARAHRGAEQRAVTASSAPTTSCRAPATPPSAPTVSRRASSPPSATTSCSRCTPRASRPARSQSPDGDEHQRRIAERIEHALTTIEELLKSILDISKLEAGVLTPALRAGTAGRSLRLDRARHRAAGARQGAVDDVAPQRAVPSFPIR